MTGHGRDEEPWVTIGVGVHFGKAWMGSVGSASGVAEVTVLGDIPNLTSRLASAAAKGEVLVTKECAEAAGMSVQDLPVRQLSLKGRSEKAEVCVITIPSSKSIYYA